MPQETMAEYIRNRLASHTIDTIRMNLKLNALHDGHFSDEQSIVELDDEGNVMTITTPGLVRQIRQQPEPEKEEKPAPVKKAAPKRAARKPKAEES